jgi:hypothetical protein
MQKKLIPASKQKKLIRASKTGGDYTGWAGFPPAGVPTKKKTASTTPKRKARSKKPESAAKAKGGKKQKTVG